MTVNNTKAVAGDPLWFLYGKNACLMDTLAILNPLVKFIGRVHFIRWYYRSLLLNTVQQHSEISPKLPLFSDVSSVQYVSGEVLFWQELLKIATIS